MMQELQNGKSTANGEGPILLEDRVPNSPAAPVLKDPQSHGVTLALDERYVNLMGEGLVVS
jgi:hypothetical protein